MEPGCFRSLGGWKSEAMVRRYAHMSVKQAADIRTEMATRLAAAVATEKAAQKEAMLSVSLPWVSRACIEHSVNADGWLYTAGAEAPDYVIVLHSANGDIIPPAR